MTGNIGYRRMIGKNIQDIRKEKGLTLSAVAERANVSKSYLSNIERDFNQNPSIHVMERIAAVLDVDMRTLLGLEQELQIPLEAEWVHFVNELKKTGIEKERLDEYKTVIEFIKWQNKDLEKYKP